MRGVSLHTLLSSGALSSHVLLGLGFAQAAGAIVAFPLRIQIPRQKPQPAEIKTDRVINPSCHSHVTKDIRANFERADLYNLP